LAGDFSADLLLTGEEPGKNKGGRVDSFARNIYIHGTNDEDAIGTPSSHGCIRLHPDDVAALFPTVEAGTPVLLIYHRLLVARIGDRVFLEVHRDIYGKQPSIEAELKQLAESEILVAVDWARIKFANTRHRPRRDPIRFSSWTMKHRTRSDRSTKP
jgi:hypothetical protein